MFQDIKHGILLWTIVLLYWKDGNFIYFAREFINHLSLYYAAQNF